MGGRNIALARSRPNFQANAMQPKWTDDSHLHAQRFVQSARQLYPDREAIEIAVSMGEPADVVCAFEELAAM